MRHHRNSSGFTLVELLVTIGIIALLISLLLPALSSVRRRGRELTCASHQRELGVMIVQRSLAHDGYAQPVGTLVVLNGGQPADLPVRLWDASRTRYTYSDLSLFEQSDGLTQALLSFDDDLRRFNGGDGSTDGLFLCPEGRPEPGPQMFRYQLAADQLLLLGNPVATDFALNECVLGFGAAQNEPRRLRGHLSRVRGASRTVLLGDSDEVGGSSPLQTWQANVGVAGGPVALGEVPAGGAGVVPSAPVIGRHRGRANLLFVDGHAGGFAATPGGLAEPLLVAE